MLLHIMPLLFIKWRDIINAWDCIPVSLFIGIRSTVQQIFATTLHFDSRYLVGFYLCLSSIRITSLIGYWFLRVKICMLFTITFLYKCLIFKRNDLTILICIKFYYGYLIILIYTCEIILFISCSCIFIP